MTLSDDQVGMIRLRIDQSAIRIETLRDDVLDHVCCLVEIKTESGIAFEKALADAIREVAPLGLDELQHETMFLLHFKNILRMKKAMYLVGLLSSMTISIGWLFSVMHWPGGMELFHYGFFGFALLFLPMMAFHQFNVAGSKSKPEKARIILGLISALLACGGGGFKMLHWPGADQLILMAALVFIFGFLPILFFTLYRKSVSQMGS